MADGTEIRLTIESHRGALKLKMKAPEKPLLSLPLTITPARLTELRRTFGKGLRAFVDTLNQSGRVTKKEPVAELALRQLYGIGTQLGFGIFGAHAGHLVGEYLRDVVPGWKEAANESYTRPRIQLYGSFEHPLPLEFVPLFDTTQPNFSQASFENIAARFPVFSTIFCRSPERATRRVITNASVMPNGKIVNDKALLVRLFVHEELPGAGRAFASTPGVVVRGPWPDAPLSAGDFIESFARRMFSASDSSDDDYPSRDTVQHFSCHCDTRPASSADHVISLGYRKARFGIVPGINTLDATLGELGGRAFGWPGPKSGSPLVFLNACGSSQITAEGVNSFPDLFLEAGCSAVIGTEVAVPDTAAGHFATTFYASFMAGKDLGEAMFEARLALLRKFNPIGAIYSAYAHPHLRLRDKLGQTA